MRQLTDSLNKIWNEYKRRLEIIESNEYTIINARQYVCQLDSFMKQKGYEDYFTFVGEEFLSFINNDVQKSKFLYRYKRIIAHINSCLSGVFWSEDFRLCCYSIKNKHLLNLYQILCKKLDDCNFQSNVNNTREYARRCFNHLDIFMLEKGIDKYSPEIGVSFIECMKQVSHKGESCFKHTYTYTIARLNDLFSSAPAYHRIPAEYKIKNQEIRAGLDKLISVLNNNNYSVRSINIVIHVIKHLDLYMIDQSIDSYSEQVGKEFSDWFNQHQIITDSHDGYQRYILAHFNDVMAGRNYCCCHRESGLPIMEAFRKSFDLFFHDCEIRGNKASTLKYKTYCCAYFFEVLISLGCTSPQTVDVEMVEKSCALINASTWNVIRGYLNSCFTHNLTDKDYSFFVPHKRGRVILPTYYSKEERQKLEAAPDRTTPIGKRDYAIILIVNHLGLRSSDITHMTFSNLLSQDGTISFEQYKTGNKQILPLIKNVEEAVQDYVNNGRPSSEKEEIFLKSHAPYAPLTSPSIYRIITRNLVKAGVNIGERKHGGHALRSSLLTSMINNGMTYEEARYALGHTGDESIKHYVSLDIKHLRLCASDIPSPSGKFKDLLNTKEQGGIV